MWRSCPGRACGRDARLQPPHDKGGRSWAGWWWFKLGTAQHGRGKWTGPVASFVYYKNENYAGSEKPLPILFKEKESLVYYVLWDELFLLMYNIQYTIYNIQYTIYNIQYTIYNIQYTIYNIQYTLEFYPQNPSTRKHQGSMGARSML